MFIKKILLLFCKVGTLHNVPKHGASPPKLIRCLALKGTGKERKAPFGKDLTTWMLRDDDSHCLKMTRTDRFNVRCDTIHLFRLFIVGGRMRYHRLVTLLCCRDLLVLPPW